MPTAQTTFWDAAQSKKPAPGPTSTLLFQLPSSWVELYEEKGMKWKKWEEIGLKMSFPLELSRTRKLKHYVQEPSIKDADALLFVWVAGGD